MSRKIMLRTGIALVLIAVLFLFGCPSEDEAYSLAEEHYLSGWVLHNINDSTDPILVPNLSQGSELNYTFNYPGDEPVSYFNILWYTSPVYKYSSASASASWLEIDVPVTKTFYFYGVNPVPEEYESQWSLSNYQSINYKGRDNASTASEYESLQFEYDTMDKGTWNGVAPEPGVKRTIYFGTAPYKLPSIIVEDGSAKLSGRLIQGQGGNSYLKRQTQYGLFTLPVPSFEIFKDEELAEAGNLTTEFSLWNHSLLDYSLSPGNYTVNVNATSNYPVWNNTFISASFEYPSEESNPPVLGQIMIQPRFELEVPLNISVNITDDSAIDTLELWYNTDANTTWTQLILDENYSSQCTIEEGSELNIKVVAIDPYNNSAMWIVCPVALLERVIDLNLSSDTDSVSMGQKILINGRCQDSLGDNCSGLRLKYYLNGEAVGVDRTEFYDAWDGRYEAGEFNFNISIPYAFEWDEANISVVFEGSGVYPQRTETLTIPVESYEHDIAIYNLSISGLAVGSTAEVRGIVYNNGHENDTEVNVSLMIDGEIVDSALIDELNSSQNSGVTIEWTIEESGTFNVSLVVQTLDDFMGNNIISTTVSVGADVGVDLSVPQWSLKVNDTISLRVDYSNSGDFAATNLSASLYDWYEYTSIYFPFGEQYEIDFNGTAYTIYAERDGTNVRINVSYGDNSETYSIPNTNGVALGDGKRLSITYIWGDYCDLLLGFANLNQTLLADVAAGGTKTAYINFSTAIVGKHELEVFVNASSDSDWSDNGDYSSVNVKLGLPDLVVGVSGYTYQEVNVSNDLDIYLYNDGYLDSEAQSGALIFFHPFVEEYISYGEPENVSLDGETYLIGVEKSGESALWNISFNGESEEHLLATGENASLSNGVVLETEYVGTDGATMIFGVVASTQIEIPPVKKEFSKSFHKEWTPTELGEYIIKLVVDSSYDGNPSNNYDYMGVVVKRPGPDLTASIYSYGTLLEGQNNSLEIGLCNLGTSETWDITANFFVLSDVFSRTVINGSSVEYGYGGLHYNISLYGVESEGGNFTFAYNGTTERLLLHDNGFDQLENGVWAFVRLYDDYGVVSFGNGSMNIFEFDSLDREHCSYENVEVYTPLRGYVWLVLFTNITEDSNWASNYYSIYKKVYAEGPDVYTQIQGYNYYPANQTSEINVYITNSGTQDALNGELSFYVFSQHEDYYRDWNHSVTSTFNGTAYAINASKVNSTSARVNISYGNTSVEEVLVVGEVLELPNAVFFSAQAIFDHFECYLSIGDYTTEISSVPEGDTNTLAFGFTPQEKRQYTLYAYWDATGDTELLNNLYEKTVFAKHAGPDMYADFTIQSFWRLEETGLYPYSFNRGTEGAENVSYWLYDDGVLLTNMTNHSVARDESLWEEYRWTPSGVGKHTFTLITSCENDSNLSNNIATDSVYIYTLENRTISINSSSENNSVSTRNIQYMNPEEIEVQFPTDDLKLGYLENGSYATSSFFYSNTSENLSVESDLIETLGHKYFVYTNNISWAFNHSEFALYYYNFTDYVTNLTDFVIYGCQEFSDGNCTSNWRILNGELDWVIGSTSIISAQAFGSSSTTFAIGERDSDLDGLPNSLEADNDNDGVDDNDDNCPNVANPKQIDADNDTIGDLCDSDADGDGVADTSDPIVGLATSVDSNKILTIFVGNSSNLTESVSSEQVISIKADNATLVEFPFNFSLNSLDLTNITLKTQSVSATRGYLLISGLNLAAGDKKTVHVDRLSGVSSVCVKDAEVSNISEMSSACDGANEYIVRCNGLNSSGYTCTISGSSFVVTGLSHSAVQEVREVTGGGSSTGSRVSGISGFATSCIPKTTCGNWSSCLNGIQKRSCNENCSKNSSVETRSCGEPIPDGMPNIQPDIIPVAMPSCSDGELNQNEQDVDCGGVCAPCRAPLKRQDFFPENNLSFLVGVVAGIVVGGLLALTFLHHRKEKPIGRLILDAEKAVHKRNMHRAAALYASIKAAYTLLPKPERDKHFQAIIGLYQDILEKAREKKQG